ncbi:ras-related protein Rab-9B isoform X3 [Falco biarmicus]|uniref:ras-related protein Rab-9B isoform X3 n=1 Tax=Falco peregrinus TaxID=8954 RepID=UPI000FFC1370|nr:ras-related protein Rab-9B isoform X3 [Falco peregrinus]XP_027662299.1 ras-related protein Rab-9B isoform X3 [Falco cherrug]XP_037264340.1 ras-related protein Rab-9B isoform X2 [Falco rusticolus]XP_040470505.1 ras-related protein Rab-9B isoform X2 [Falco naumanni]XP_055583761.1 ras-related protein Rab-9B isoform X3 [Falco cherrug]XP_055674304.1 ras-related protein Rab-9B isoform X3 [Falco peregrinus]XP_056216083.1 ras-related protein Rab-9B isoform X3 [Falco biarmicus]XP_056216084.1 ras-r
MQKTSTAPVVRLPWYCTLPSCCNEWEVLALKGHSSWGWWSWEEFPHEPIWDTAGQERFKSLRTPFYRGADCCLLTFSVDDRQSFENLSNWQKEFVYYADVKDPEHFPFVVLGNKIDKFERQVSTEEAQAWCMENGNYPYLETSAKDDTNVAVAFEEAVRQVLAVEEQLEHCMLGHTVDLHSSSKSGSSCC